MIHAVAFIDERWQEHFLFGKYSQALFTWLRQCPPCRFQCHSYDERTKLQHSLKLMVPKATVCCGIKCKCSTQGGHESQIWQILEQHLMVKYDKTGILFYYSFPLRFAQYWSLWLEHAMLRSVILPSLLYLLCNLRKSTLPLPLQQFSLPDSGWYIKKIQENKTPA